MILFLWNFLLTFLESLLSINKRKLNNLVFLTSVESIKNALLLLFCFHSDTFSHKLFFFSELTLTSIIYLNRFATIIVSIFNIRFFHVCNSLKKLLFYYDVHILLGLALLFCQEFSKWKSVLIYPQCGGCSHFLLYVWLSISYLSIYLSIYLSLYIYIYFYLRRKWVLIFLLNKENEFTSLVDFVNFFHTSACLYCMNDWGWSCIILVDIFAQSKDY